ncbi:FecR protein domain protein [Rhodopirellula maiorica SM1]|uniref:FecR protein domain protein n=1 Tax=Rhodopirellula maiorica SM1 TaxID=1265738 RepID=M5RLZ0_9BACT|nr:LamG-like jellyroll fold domain-containing protein [Rhodopirellula maiorica]EMI16402.1 FecR protein domain protein [Rhodopirellula maiorica SM1]
MNERHLTEQLDRLLDGELSDAEMDRLARDLASDDSLYRRYRDQVEMDESLAMVVRNDRSADDFAQRLEQRIAAESEKFDFLHSVLDRSSLRVARQQLRRWAPLAVAAIAASVMIAFWAGMWTGRHSGSGKPRLTQATKAPVAAEPVDNSVALLNQVVDVAWLGDTTYSVGDSISSNATLHLESGLVQLQFFRGAVLTLQGPARLEIRDSNHVMLHEGNAWAKVPVPARGFTVLTPQTKIVDLGTEFGVSASPGNSTEVHVFDGLVELYGPSAAADADSLHELVTGESISVDEDGRSAAVAKRITAMPSESLLQRDHNKQLQQRYERWQRWSAEIRNDPRVLMYYDFAPPQTSAGMLENLAVNRTDSDGSIIGCAWTEGRWPQKSALDFKRPSDRVRFHLAGEYESITLAAWVRVDGLDRLLSSLLLTDGWDAGEVHWQFDQLGQLGLSVSQASGVAWRYTPPLVDLTRLGQWIHVASVFDGRSKTVRHYFNGQRVPCEASLDYDGPLRIGDAELCNWGRPVDKTSHAIRNFNGRMDEFLMLGDALDENEIGQIYEAGNPKL